MAKIFTITEGLENLGALKTGGQGSVYKGRRTGTIITAVKILPTPVLPDQQDDKNYRDFTNEVEKLKKVNEEPNPNVVRILDYGITDTGSLPFIEMEFIEGPDLGELISAPNPPVFTIDETIKVARHIANALSHSHKAGVRHGDIKSNNIKFNNATGNYMLLDFGLAMMPDEHRRTSLRHAGAIEFMAPEQNEGHTFFQTDIYSFGIVLYELLCGQVPFPLKGTGETARNAVMLAHLESTPPDMALLRKQHLPDSWAPEESVIPSWLPEIIGKCLEKDPEKRFANGTILSEQIKKDNEAWVANEKRNAALVVILEKENVELKAALLSMKKEKDALQIQSGEMNTRLAQKSVNKSSVVAKSSRPLILILSIACLALAALSGVLLIRKPTFISSGNARQDSITTPKKLPAPIHDSNLSTLKNNRKETTLKDDTRPVSSKTDTLHKVQKANEQPKLTTRKQNEIVEKTVVPDPKKNMLPNKKQVARKPSAGRQMGEGGLFKVRSTAYFYSEPSDNTRRRAFMNHWDGTILEALDDVNGFIYVIYTNEWGQTTKGWLRKADLIRIDR